MPVPLTQEAKKVAPIFNLHDTQGMWLQIIHKKNIANRFFLNTKPLFSSNAIKKNFLINYKLKIYPFNVLHPYLATFIWKVKIKLATLLK